MEVTFLISLGLVALAVLLFATLIGIVLYSGLFATIDVGAGKPLVKNLTIAYKFGRGPYKNTSEIFTEVTSIAPKQRCIGVYYDDPRQVPAEALRSAVGCILAEDKEIPDAELVIQLQKFDFKLFVFPQVSNVVRTSFPYTTPLSIFFAIYRVYPLLSEYITVNKLCAHPFLEIYDGNKIHFLAPLAKQDEFYVPETDKTLEEEEEEAEKESETEEPQDQEIEENSITDNVVEETIKRSESETKTQEKDLSGKEQENEEEKSKSETVAERVDPENIKGLNSKSGESNGQDEHEKVEEKANMTKEGNTEEEKSVPPAQSKQVQDSGVSSSTDSTSAPSSPATSDQSSYTESSTLSTYTDSSHVTSFTESSVNTSHRESSSTTDASFTTAASALTNKASEFSSDSSETSSFEEVKMDDVK